MHGNNEVGEARCPSFDKTKASVRESGAVPTIEAHREHIGREIVDIQNDTRPQKTWEEGGDHEEVWRIVNLDDAVLSPQH